jgi:uncharacterized protein (TIGR02284 family)
MANTTTDIRSTLNSLIETLKDGEQGFRTSADKLEDPSLRAQFHSFASQRNSFARALQVEVSRIGGQPETTGSTAASLHRSWIDLKSSVVGNSDLAILEEAERGEDSAVKAYREALSKDLPEDIRGVINGQFKDILATHNTVKALRYGVAITTTAAGTPRAY